MEEKLAAKPIGVLLVNEFPVVAWGLERLVETKGPAMVVHGVAATHVEAMAILSDAVPDVMIVDVDGEHGFESIEALQAASSAKILALTASREADVHDRAVLAGACGVVRKSEPVAVLLKAIERVHMGEIWIDRIAAGRIFFELARKKNAEQEKDPEAAKIALLTRKERATVAEVAQDASATPRQIAEQLHISEYTLRNHLTSIYAKLGLGSRLELYAYARRHGITRA